MPPNRPNSRRIPDWQVDCIDGKAKWLLPWAIFAVLLLALMTRILAPWFLDGETLKFKFVYQLPLSLATGTDSRGPETVVIRIDREQNIRVGESTFEFVQHEGERHMFWVTDPSWRQQVRRGIQTYLKKYPKTSTIVIQVAPNVQLEVIATVSASAQSMSVAHQYLDVTQE